MLQNDCTLPLTSDLFAQAIHPTEPLLTVGLASGHVECFRLPTTATSSSGPSSDSGDNDGSAAITHSPCATGKAHISSLWRTKRHQGSCRALSYDPTGSYCYSAGTDALLKQFSPLTGEVVSKVRIPPSLPTRGHPDQPSVMSVLSPQILLLACDSGAIHLYDLRADNQTPGAKPAQIHIAHDDYVSSLTPLPSSAPAPSSYPKQFISTGSTTLAVTDIRKGILAKSADQEDELLCSVFVPGLGPKKNRSNGILFTGTSSGVVALWDRGSWDDQQDRVYVNRLESVDALCQFPGGERKVVAAVGNGHLSILNAETREMEETLAHDDEGAVAVGFDCYGRMISGGGKVVKVWEEVDGPWEDAEADMDAGVADDDSDDYDEDDGEDDDNDGDLIARPGKRRRGGRVVPIPLKEDEDEGQDSSEEEKPEKKKKKKKKGKGKKAARQQQVGTYGHHGIMGFRGL